MTLNPFDRTTGQSDFEGPVVNFAPAATKMYQRIALVHASQLNDLVVRIEKTVSDEV